VGNSDDHGSLGCFMNIAGYPLETADLRVDRISQ